MFRNQNTATQNFKSVASDGILDKNSNVVIRQILQQQMNPISLEEALEIWYSKRRRMGCVSATAWLCKRVPRFEPLRLRRYLQGGTDLNGNYWEHVVASDGVITIDLAPYADSAD